MAYKKIIIKKNRNIQNMVLQKLGNKELLNSLDEKGTIGAP